MSVQTAVQQCRIELIDRGDGPIKFQFAPSGLKDTKAANYSDISILGRSSPFKSYSNGPSRVISFTIDFYANPEKNYAYSLEQIRNTIWQMLSLPYPDYSTGFVIKPPTKCYLIMGELIPQFRCVCKQATVSYRDDIPWDLGSLIPFGASISLIFEECVESPLDYQNIISGQFDA